MTLLDDVCGTTPIEVLKVANREFVKRDKVQFHWSDRPMYIHICRFLIHYPTGLLSWKAVNFCELNCIIDHLEAMAYNRVREHYQSSIADKMVIENLNGRIGQITKGFCRFTGGIPL